MQKHLYELLKNRVFNNTGEDRLVQSADTQEWYHLVWERMSDAAFLYFMEKDERLGKWVHDRTMEIVGEGIEQANEYLDKEKVEREAYYLSLVS